MENNKNLNEYFIGLDVGTNSIGWAVSDSNYNVIKHKGNAMWGVRLFEEAQDASERRSSRTSRRRLERSKQRILLLEMLFAEELAKTDKGFLTRIHESALWENDKSEIGKNSLFNDINYSDKNYHINYPTIYHLRQELITSDDEHDIRLVYLALHHIMKSRGHFLYDDGGNDGEPITVETAMGELTTYLADEYNVQFVPENKEIFFDALISSAGITAKKKLLKAAMGTLPENELINPAYALDLLSGATLKLADIFSDDELKTADIKSISLKNDIEEHFDELSVVLGDRVELLLKLKNVFDTARLSGMLNGCKYISEAKVLLYEKNKKDLTVLKHYVKQTVPGKYKSIFSEKKEKLNNYAAYCGYKGKSGEYSCNQEDFCKYLKSVLPEPSQDDVEMTRIYTEIKDGVLLTKLRTKENGLIPYQLHKYELTAILENASHYLSFLNDCDESGISVKEKIIKTFEFKVPYYVGPLNKNSSHGWAVRFVDKQNEKIYPWNFESVVDIESSASKFIENLIGRCTYTGEKVLPKDSLLYSEFALLNEINTLRINGKELPINAKSNLINDLFYVSKQKITKKRVKEYLLANGYIDASDEISGIDDKINSSLKAYHDFKNIIDKTHDTEMVENIIRSILIFGEDKKMLKKWLTKNTHGLTEKDISYICRLKYSDWGRLSETFLTGIYSPNKYGEATTIMDCLRNSSCNLMQLLSDDYEFAKNAELHRSALLGNNRGLTEKLDELYIAPAVRRSIRQTVRIVDEIVKIQKAAPSKIFIEMARGSAQDLKNKRTESRKNKLIQLYKDCKETSSELFAKLENEDENKLRSDKLYLYYTQMGKCMYTGEPIDLAALANGELYDIDHIFPQSKVKDNSLDNRVLVKNIYNREKSNTYPISTDIRTKMYPIWAQLKKQGFISEKKFDRLTRSYPLTDKELSDFVARQLVETQQSTKALAGLLKDTLGDKTRIVYSKAGNVSDFRHEYDMIKSREVNDLHHAKDAYLNIVVGNVYDTKFTSRFFANIQNENYSLNKVFEFPVKGAWDCDKSFGIVRKTMLKNNVLVTRMPKEVKGALYDLQIKPAGKGQLEKKKGLSIEKYGGYNKISGAYFCAVEHTEKKKRIRTIEPVYIYKKELFESDPEKYCRNILGLSEPRIIASKIRIDALLELDGKRINISSRTGNNIIYKHSYQLAVGYEWEKYIKELQKYAERCAARKAELPITEHDGISAGKNEELYDLFSDKCNTHVYADFFKNMRADIVANREKFTEMSMLEQVQILLEILKAFKCNAQTSDLTKLCGKGVTGRIQKSKKISGFTSAYIINQSVTGLYETKTDLLK